MYTVASKKTIDGTGGQVSASKPIMIAKFSDGFIKALAVSSFSIEAWIKCNQ